MCHGSASGGTIASAGQGMKDMYHGIKDGTMTMEYANDPYILVPELANLSAADASCTRTDTDATGFGNLPRFDRVFSSVSIPHFMAYVNSKVVRRSQFLLRPNARISYSESMTVASMIDAIWWSIPHWISGEIPMMPAQGGGPGSVAREKGGFAIKVKASNAELGDVEFEGVGSGDPGYAHTSRILAEVGLCLLDDECKTKGGGVKTVASSVRSSELRKRFAAATGPDGNPLLVYTKVAGKGGAGGEL
jgi:short subunit dehydrogenase-like uncharacterized protein